MASINQNYDLAPRYFDKPKTWKQHQALLKDPYDLPFKQHALVDPFKPSGLIKPAGKTVYEFYESPSNPLKKKEGLGYKYTKDTTVSLSERSGQLGKPPKLQTKNRSDVIPLTLYDPPLKLRGMQAFPITKEDKIRAWKQLESAGIVKKNERNFITKGSIHQSEGPVEPVDAPVLVEAPKPDVAVPKVEEAKPAVVPKEEEAKPAVIPKEEEAKPKIDVAAQELETFTGDLKSTEYLKANKYVKEMLRLVENRAIVDGASRSEVNGKHKELISEIKKKGTKSPKEGLDRTKELIKETDLSLSFYIDMDKEGASLNEWSDIHQRLAELGKELKIDNLRDEEEHRTFFSDIQRSAEKYEDLKKYHAHLVHQLKSIKTAKALFTSDEGKALIAALKTDPNFREQDLVLNEIPIIYQILLKGGSVDDAKAKINEMKDKAAYHPSISDKELMLTIEQMGEGEHEILEEILKDAATDEERFAILKELLDEGGEAAKWVEDSLQYVKRQIQKKGGAKMKTSITELTADEKRRKEALRRGQALRSKTSDPRKGAHRHPEPVDTESGDDSFLSATSAPSPVGPVSKPTTLSKTSDRPVGRIDIGEKNFVVYQGARGGMYTSNEIGRKVYLTEKQKELIQRTSK